MIDRDLVKANAQKYTNECWAEYKDKFPDTESKTFAYKLVGEMWEFFKSRIPNLENSTGEEYQCIDALVMQIATAYGSVLDSVKVGKYDKT